MLTPEQAEALDVARQLAAAGIPVFVAKADPSKKVGFALPRHWGRTRPDPAVLDAWQPGDAVAVVMGHGLDLLDIDPHSGGNLEAFNGHTPTSYGTALTPSGGVHSFIRSLGVRSRDKVVPGVDVKSGAPDGKGRGFAFIAPTMKPSKVTGQPVAYRWATRPDITRLGAVLRGDLVDESGRALVDMIEQARAAAQPSTEAPAYDGPPFDELPEDKQTAIRRWVTAAVEGITAELRAAADWPAGHTDDRGRGWEKLCADAAYRLGRLARATWNDLELVDLQASYLEAAPVDGTWGTEDVELKWTQQAHRGEPAGLPDLSSASERDEEAWRLLGVDTSLVGTPPAQPSGSSTVQTSGPFEPVEGEQTPGPNPAKYFGEGGLQAATMAADVLALGPLRQGRDHIMWSYAGGVWSPDKRVVEARLTRLLRQRFRTSYVGTTEAFVRAYVETITCDPIPHLVNFRNGLLDWRAGELLPHDPNVPSTVQLGVEYDPDADCPAFEEFVHQVVPADVVPTIWELIGYLMYSGNPLHKAVMLTGKGRNGKGTFLRVLEAVLGSRNVTSVSLHDLVNTRFTTASLFGKLANIAGDIDATYMENTATFKGITGGDTISAEHKGRDRFDFKPWAVPVFSANKIPASADTSSGYLARWLVVPFPNSFLGREDRHLDARLARPEELRGIASRGIAALEGLLARGDFELTASGEAAREDFVRRVDQVRTWVADCCSVHPDHPWTARTELYTAYKQWAFRDGHKPVRASEFYDRLEEAGGVPAVLHGTRGFKHIAVLDNGLAGGPAAAPWLPTPGPMLPPTAPGAGLGAGSVGAPQTGGTAGQPESIRDEGAEGADTSQPPYARDVQVGGLQTPAPSAPTYIPELGTAPDNVDSRPSTTGRPGDPEWREQHAVELEARRQAKQGEKRKQTPSKATETARAKREAARLEAIAAAAGPILSLPAVVTRDGSVRVTDAAGADAILATITGGTGQALTVDVEHTGYPIGHEHYELRTVQLGGEHFALVLDPSEPDQADVVRRHLAAAPVLHAHSATADLVPLAAAGLVDAENAWAKMLDTGVLAKLSDPASTGNDADLKGLSRNVLGRDGTAAVSPQADKDRSALFKAGKWLTEVEVTTPVERSGWAQVDPCCETMIRYAGSDVLDGAALAARLPRPAPEVLERELAVQRMTARISHVGIALDGEHVEELLTEHRAKREVHRAEVQAFGVDNPGSSQQVAKAFTDMGVHLPPTDAGKPSVAKAVLEPMRTAEGRAGDLARAVLAYRHHNTALVLLLEPYGELVTRGDGRARPTVYTLGADTGRMSSSRPNVQQVSREGGMRACFTADPGHVLVSADFAGVELRVAAALSGDAGLAAIMGDPERDLHWEVARLAFGPNATKAQRYAIKRGVFGRIYGGGISAVAAGVGVTHPVAKQVIDAMDALTPQLAAWSQEIRGAVEAGRTRFPAYSGRVIHLPKNAPHAGPNYCIQGTARELLVDALLRWRETPWGGAPLFPVHDELVVMVPEAAAEAATAALVQCMTTDLYGVPIIAEASEPSYAWKDSA